MAENYPEIFKYGKSKNTTEVLGLQDVLIAKGKSTFSFLGKYGKSKIKVGYDKNNKKYYVLIDDNTKNIITCKTKSDLIAFLTKHLEENGFKDKDENTSISLETGGNEELSTDISESFSLKEYIKENGRSYGLKENFPASYELSNLELINFYKDLLDDESIDFWMEKEKRLMEKGFFKLNTMKTIGKTKEGKKVLKEMFYSQPSNLLITVHLLQATKEKDIPLNHGLSQIRDVFNNFSLESELDWVEETTGDYQDPDIFMEELFSGIIEERGIDTNYNISDENLKIILDSVKNDNIAGYSMFENFYKKIENVKNEETLLRYLLKEDNIVTLHKIDGLINFDSGLIVDNLESIIENSVKYILSGKSNSARSQEIIKTIKYLIDKIGNKIDNSIMELKLTEYLEKFQNQMKTMEEGIENFRIQQQKLKNKDHFSSIQKIKFFFQGGIKKIKTEEAKIKQKYFEENRSLQNLLQQEIDNLNTNEKDVKLLIIKLNKNIGYLKENQILLGKLINIIKTNEEKLIKHSPEIKEIISDINDVYISNINSHINLSQNKLQLNIDNINKVIGKMKKEFIPTLLISIKTLKEFNRLNNTTN